MVNENPKAQQDHWTERGRAASVSNSDATGRPRRSVLALGILTRDEIFNRPRIVGVTGG